MREVVKPVDGGRARRIKQGRRAVADEKHAWSQYGRLDI